MVNKTTMRAYAHALKSNDIKVKASMFLLLSKLNKNGRLNNIINLLKKSI